jgi:hypothetical protein
MAMGAADATELRRPALIDDICAVRRARLIRGPRSAATAIN